MKMKVIGATLFKRTSLPTSDTNQKEVRSFSKSK